MSLSHCPLCMALAVVSTAHGLSLALQLWQLVAPVRWGAALAASPALPMPVR